MSTRRASGSRATPKRKRPAASAGAQVAGQVPLAAQAQSVTMAAGYAIVGLAVLGGFVLSFHPQTFGLRGTNPAVGIGLATLAGLRLWALRRELNRQAHDKEMPA